MSGEKSTPPGADTFRASIPTDKEKAERQFLDDATSASMFRGRESTVAKLLVPENKGPEGDLGKTPGSFSSKDHPHTVPEMPEKK